MKVLLVVLVVELQADKLRMVLAVACSVPVLADKNHLIRRRPRNDADRAGMNHDFAETLVPGRFDHSIFSNLNVAAFVGEM